MNEVGPGSLRRFNGLASRTVFCFWFGDFRSLSPNRIVALFTMYQRIGVPLCLVTADTLKNWVHPDYPLHRAFQYLSDVHKSDYLRAYFMHVYGGGYSDIKATRTAWNAIFDSFDAGSAEAIGYRELRPTCVALNGTAQETAVRNAYQELIGMCSYLMRPQSELTAAYLSGIERILTDKQELLRTGPPLNAYDSADKLFEKNPSAYPLRWTEIGSEVFHYVSYELRERLSFNDSLCPVLTRPHR